MNKVPTTCVIYYGVNDIIDKTPSDKILDDLGSLTSDLKEKNGGTNLYVCQVVPPPVMLNQYSAEIEAYSDVL